MGKETRKVKDSFKEQRELKEWGENEAEGWLLIWFKKIYSRCHFHFLFNFYFVSKYHLFSEIFHVYFFILNQSYETD